MNAQTALQELEALAKKLEIDVVYDSLGGEIISGGGLCKLKGRWRVMLERRNAPSEHVSMLARTLAEFDVDEHYLSPALRELLDRHREARAGGAVAGDASS